MDATTNQEERATCEKVLSRQRLDKKHGRTTSQAAIDFIRRTCPCISCRTARVAKMRAPLDVRL